MGTADAVPGVSGGTIALIAGVYERLISAISAITVARIKRFLRALLPIGDGVSRGEASVVAVELDIWFIVPLITGVGTAIVVVTRIVHVASQAIPALLFGFFFGLIAASELVLLRALSVRTGFQAAVGVAGFLLAFIISGPKTILHGHGLAIVFFSGSVAVSAMILPGVSGSLILVLLGQYTQLSTTLTEFVDGVVSVPAAGSVSRLVEPGTVVLTFVLGGVAGLLSVSRLVRRALGVNKRATLSFLVGMVGGALRAPVERVNETAGFSAGILTAFLTSAVLGATVFLLIDRYVGKFDFESV
jgi:putative membrane protein